MKGFAPQAIGDLVAAAGAVGYHDGVGLPTQGRQQARFRHLHRDVVVACFVAKAAGHAAAGTVDQLGPGIGYQA